MLIDETVGNKEEMMDRERGRKFGTLLCRVERATLGLAR